MRTRDAYTISLPPAISQALERARKTEQRSRSEIIREALRAYLTRTQALPVYTPTAAERRAMEKGRAEILRGDSYTLDALKRSLDTHHRGTRAENPRARTAPRTRTAARRA